jgi:hypothetical protein
VPEAGIRQHLAAAVEGAQLVDLHAVVSISLPSARIAP